ncbi:uncharacterized protein LOC132295313 [Cornus florida]|uniref:uncharacterized protein LOC132295313 n=1 Tax=Cornus florida TaxID=4283 RepID=UPI00289988A4|nr:uncharacterized protein LOC132295313 [Cornus florida]
MVSLENIQATSTPIEPNSSPRISFSTDFFDEEDFISIDLNSQTQKEHRKAPEKTRNNEFEFLSGDFTSQTAISTADELFSQGKLLPFCQTQNSETPNKMSLKMEGEEEKEVKKEESKVSWFMDDDPSPRPPNCTVLWKELLRLKKQRAASLSTSSSSSSSRSSSSIGDLAPIDEGKEALGKREKHVKRIKKGLDRARSVTVRIRPVVNVPICTQGKKTALPPLFSLKKGRLER